MKHVAGLWIDHRQTVIVLLSGKTEEITRITSHVEKHVPHSGSGQEAPIEDHRDRRFLDHLNKYYDEVITHLHGAESILILGPGEAKSEFAKRLRSEHPAGSIVGVETADRMTDHQIVARVRQHFIE